MCLHGKINCLQRILQFEILRRRFHVRLHVFPVIDSLPGLKDPALLLDERRDRNIEEFRKPDELVRVGLIFITLPGRYRLESNTQFIRDLLLCILTFLTKLFNAGSDTHIHL